MALHEYQKQMYKKIGVIAALIILPIAGFFVGVHYQQQTSTANHPSDLPIKRPSSALRVMGIVKAISSNSITVTERFNNTDKTYTLTSSTTYKNGTSDAKASDIKTGDTVMLILDASDHNKITSVIVNPMFHGTDNGSGPSVIQDDNDNTMVQ
jgi:hypothetical protein